MRMLSLAALTIAAGMSSCSLAVVTAPAANLSVPQAAKVAPAGVAALATPTARTVRA